MCVLLCLTLKHRIPHPEILFKLKRAHEFLLPLSPQLLQQVSHRNCELAIRLIHRHSIALLRLVLSLLLLG